jgi:hypothetical protein
VENPVQHIRGFYDVPETEPGNPNIEPYRPIDDPLEAERLGWYYDTQQQPDGSLITTVHDANGTPQEYIRSNTVEGTQRMDERIGRPPRTAQEIMNTNWQTNEERARQSMLRHLNLRNQRAYEEATRERPTGKKGLAVSEFQADLAQSEGRQGLKRRPGVEEVTDPVEQWTKLQEMYPYLPPGTSRENQIKAGTYFSEEDYPRMPEDVPGALDTDWLDALNNDPAVVGLADSNRPEMEEIVGNQIDDLRLWSEGQWLNYDPASYYALLRNLQDIGVSQATLNKIPNPLGKREALVREGEYGNREVYRDNQAEQAWREATAPFSAVSADDRNALGVKRALLEAAHADQDFMAWPYADTVITANAGSGTKGFPSIYGAFEGPPSGAIDKAVIEALKPYQKELGGKPQIKRGGIEFPEQEDIYNVEDVRQQMEKENAERGGAPWQYTEPSEMQYKAGVKAPRKLVYLTDEAREAIKKKGFPFYAIPPFLLPFLGEYEDEYQFAQDVL